MEESPSLHLHVLSRPKPSAALHLYLTYITSNTEFLTFVTSGNHTEKIQLLLIHSPYAPVVLSHACLSKHNPCIDGKDYCVVEWRVFCSSNCLSQIGSGPSLPSRSPRSSLPGHYWVALSPPSSISPLTCHSILMWTGLYILCWLGVCPVMCLVLVLPHLLSLCLLF